MEARLASDLVCRERRVSPTSVWLSWLGANVLPSVAVSVMLALLATTLGTDTSAVLAYVALFGLVALMQARVWGRWRTTRGSAGATRRRWTTWTIIGLVLAMFFGVGTVATLDGLGHERLGLVLGWVIAGLVLGVVQAPMLGVSAARAIWWVVASVIGWASAAVVYAPLASVAGPLAQTPGLRWLVGGLALEGNIELAITAVTFAVYGMLTGVVLARLTRVAEPGAP
jgi:hypothetical protein